MNTNICEKCKHFEIYNFYPRMQWFCMRNVKPTDSSLKYQASNLIAQSNDGGFNNWIMNHHFEMPDNCPYQLEHILT